MRQKLQTLLFASIAMLMPIGLSAHDFEVGGIYYDIYSSEDKIVGVIYSGASDDAVADEYTGEVIIPATVTYEGVTYSVMFIFNDAFKGCTNLTNVTIPEGVTAIDGHAFQNCASLTSVTIPSSVTEIGSLAFNGCASLTSVIIPEGVTKIGAASFGGCTGLTNVTIPEGVTSIGNSAFSRCTGLTNVTIPEGVTSIGGSAFYGCSALTSITIPESVTSIGSFAFYNCAFLSSNFINKSSCTDEKNWDATFYTEDEEVNGMIIKDNVLVLARGTITSADIPTYATSIGDEAFYYCTALASVNIPSSVSSIGKSAFYGCTSLTSITIPEGVTSIVHNTFYDCTSLTSITIPESVTSIGGSAFYRCTGLTNVTIPEGVTSIGSNAFYGCTSLADITFPESLVDIKRSAFAGTQWLANQADGIVYINNMVYTYKGEMPENCAIEIAEGTTAICDNAFNGLVNLASVTIPSSVTTIWDYAFYECTNLSSVKLPTSLKNIESYAFKGTNLSAVVIPESVEALGWGVFYQCTSLTSIAIPNSMEDIGRLSFEGCTALKEVHYNGTAAQWNAITIGDTNAPLNSATRHYCVDGYCPECGVFIFGVIIRDGQHTTFTIAEEVDVPSITYTRTLPNLEWNALYVPFEIPVNELLDNYDVAYINDVHSFDNDDNGEIDDLKMEVIKITTGTLKANYPYLIRAKSEEAKAMSLELTDATLYATEENTVTCSSVFMQFDVTGTYSQMSSEDLKGSLVITTDGSWKQLAEGSVLRPFRLYLTMTALDGSPVKVSEQAARSMRIVARGESEGTTSIDNGQWTTEDETVVYDLQGRRVAQPTKGMYIVNGRKVVIK